MSNFTTARVMHRDKLFFAGDVWIEEPTKGKPGPWKAGCLLKESSGVLSGDFQILLQDGRAGTMTCTKAQPGMSGGTQFQFLGVSPLSIADGSAPPEVLSEKIDLRITKAERNQYEVAAERASLELTAWIRDRLSQVAATELRS